MQLVVGELSKLRGALDESVARQALVDLGQRLKALEGDDGVVARLQGERIALATVKPVGVALLATRPAALREALGQPLRLGSVSLQLPVAVGWSHGAKGVDQGIDEAVLVATPMSVGRQIHSATFAVAIREQGRGCLGCGATCPGLEGGPH